MLGKQVFWPVLAILTCGLACMQPALAQNANKKAADNDALQRIEGPYRDFFWRPGATLSQYKRVVILDPYIEFADGWLKAKNAGRRSFNRVDADKVEAIKAALAEDVRTIFGETLRKAGYETVNVAAPDVVVLRPAILNVDISLDVYIENRFTESGGTKMALYLEFFDAASSTLIGRAADSDSDPDSTRPIVRRILTRWAERLPDLLREGVP